MGALGSVLWLGGLGLFGDGAAESFRYGVDRAIGHGNDGADLGKGGIVENEGLVLGGDAVEDAVGIGAGEEAALGVKREAGDVGLAGFVVELGLAAGRDAIDFAVLAGADVKSFVSGDGEAPDVFGLGIEVFGRLAADDLVDLTVRRGGGVDGAGVIDGKGEEPQQARYWRSNRRTDACPERSIL